MEQELKAVLSPTAVEFIDSTETLLVMKNPLEVNNSPTKITKI